MNADGTLTDNFGRLLQRSHSHNIHPVVWIKGDVVAVSQSQILHQVVASWSVHCQCEKDVTGSMSMLIPHICPALPGQRRGEALPLPAPTYPVQLSGEHKEHRWPSPVPSPLMIRWESASSIWYTQYMGHCCWPQILSLFRAAPGASVLLQLMAPESTSPWGS